jgi:hypothetical protein
MVKPKVTRRAGVLLRLGRKECKQGVYREAYGRRSLGRPPRKQEFDGKMDQRVDCEDR